MACLLDCLPSWIGTGVFLQKLVEFCRFPSRGFVRCLLFAMVSSVFGASVSDSAVSIASTVPPSPKPPVPLFVTITMSSLTSASSVTSYLASENGDPSRGQQSPFSSSVAGHVEGSGSPPEPSSTAAVVVSLVDEVPSSVWGLERRRTRCSFL